MSSSEALEQLLYFLQAAAIAEDPKLLLVVTRGAYDANRTNFDAAVSLWGLVRSARIEMPRVIIKALDVSVTAKNQEVAKAESDIIRIQLILFATMKVVGLGC